MVVSSHELLEVARVADRIVVMADGTVARAVARGTLGPEALERAVTRTFG